MAPENGIIDLGITRDLGDFSAEHLAATITWLDEDPRIRWTYIDDGDTVADLDVIISWQPQWTSERVVSAERLTLLARWGVGTDNVDLAQCTASGTMCAITPNGVRRPVASANVAMILALTSKIVTRHREVVEGAWQRGAMTRPGMGLEGRTIGSIGLGRVASETFTLLAPFGAEFAAYSPTTPVSRGRRLGVELVDLPELLRRSDVLMINCPLTERTHGLIGARELDLMKPGSYLVNLARGAVVDEAALVRALDSGRLAGAGLDVFVEEPPPPGHPLLARDDVIVTPHMLAYTDDLFRRMAADHRATVEALLSGARPPNVVNEQVFDSPALARKLAALGERLSWPVVPSGWP